ncbi:MAG: hypothetical protein K2X86_08425 [Cytophagaceae bacterium]|nr:hypothetical protein [Cytophagaceae bacterium]
MKIAVITGDFVHSGKMSKELREILYKEFEKYLKHLGKKDKDFKGETNQGDWFQVMVKDPVKALKYALLIRSYLRSFGEELKNKKVAGLKKKLSVGLIDARVAIGVGGVDFISDRLGNSDGPAFRISGRQLEKIKKTNSALTGEMENAISPNEELKTMFLLLDFIFSKTTSLQCQVIHRKLQGLKEAEIAKEFNILQSAVNQRSSAAGWNVIEATINRFENILKA